jgi:hypothetical protein
VDKFCAACGGKIERVQLELNLPDREGWWWKASAADPGQWLCVWCREIDGKLYFNTRTPVEEAEGGWGSYIGTGPTESEERAD